MRNYNSIQHFFSCEIVEFANHIEDMCVNILMCEALPPALSIKTNTRLIDTLAVYSFIYIYISTGHFKGHQAARRGCIQQFKCQF